MFQTEGAIERQNVQIVALGSPCIVWFRVRLTPIRQVSLLGVKKQLELYRMDAISRDAFVNAELFLTWRAIFKMQCSLWDAWKNRKRHDAVVEMSVWMCMTLCVKGINLRMWQDYLGHLAYGITAGLIYDRNVEQDVQWETKQSCLKYCRWSVISKLLL